ncbi:MAG: hypothetical protein GY822_19720 [Deltaproteobacteria bacterium]|nr:hypothetical protein [Deltaproteobacteria bacterium]
MQVLFFRESDDRHAFDTRGVCRRCVLQILRDGRQDNLASSRACEGRTQEKRTIVGDSAEIAGLTATRAFLPPSPRRKTKLIAYRWSGESQCKATLAMAHTAGLVIRTQGWLIGS